MAATMTETEIAFLELGLYCIRTSDKVMDQTVTAFDEQFNFLSTFLDCSQTWSHAHEIVPDLVAKVAAAVTEMRNELKRCRNLVNCPMLCLCFAASESKNSTLHHSFAQLNEKMEVLKREIGDAYCTNLSSCLYTTDQPATSYRSYSLAGKEFCFQVARNLHVLYEKYNFNDSLKIGMANLGYSIGRLTRFLARFHSYYSLRVPLQEHHVFAQCGAVATRAAHLCSMCWAARMDQNMESNVSVSLSDLDCKIDLGASQEFLEMMLKFVVEFEVEAEKQLRLRGQGGFIVDDFRSLFLEELLNLQYNTVLYDEFYLLLSCYTKLEEMHDEGSERFTLIIKSVIMHGASLMNREYRTGEIDHAVLFARIWFLKVEIFLSWRASGITITPRLSMNSQIHNLNQGSRFLIQLLRLPEETAEKQILTFIGELPEQVVYAYSSSAVEEIKGNKIRHILHKFLVQVLLLQAKKQLFNLLNNNASLVVTSVKCQMGMLHEGLVFVIASDINQQKEITEDEKQVLTHIASLSNDVISLCKSREAKEATEEAIDKVSLKLRDLLDMLQTVKAELREIYLQLPRLNLPKTHGLCFAEFLLQSLTELLSRKPDSIAAITHQIEAICQDLKSLISSIGDSKFHAVGIKEQRDLFTRLNDAAYLAEFVIDSIVLKSSTGWHQMLLLYHASEEFRCIKMQIKNIAENQSYNVKIHNVVRTSTRLTSQATSPSIDEGMVVLKDQEEVIINRVTRGSLERNVVSIVGMAGIGKTTLANKVFCDPRVINNFYVRAWCSVSQEYKKRDLLLKILSHINKLNDNVVTMSDEDLVVMLYQKLRRNRYLIVMDDVWDTGAWDDLQSSFPNDKNGSRILITSRLHNVVLKIQPETDPHNLRLLSEEESWKLLQMKAFHGKGCPEELLEVGKEISGSCKGLPLSIVAVAGLLERMTNKPDQWKEIAETLSSRIVHDQQSRCMEILELSYNHLPDELKACFLYFGLFLNDKDIPVQKLKQMWIAEGFVQKTESMSLEDSAEQYLMDLIGRSLILVAKRRSDGGVKACRLHDMLHELCLLRGKDEKFSRLITSNDEPYAYFDDSVYDDDFDYFIPSKFQEYEERRLSICAKRKYFVLSRPSGPYVRSLLFSASNDVYTRRPYDISFISDNFKLLKLLDLECINMGAFLPDGILSLVHLRYLAVSGDIDCIPSSIASLWNLETFVVKGLKGRVLLPDTIWSMTKLRHLHVNNHVVFSLEDEETGNFCILENLLSLSSPSLSFREGTEKIISRFPNLLKLKCIFYSESQHSATNSNQFPRLELLAKLESLKVVYYGSVVDACKFSFPLSLRRLTLSKFRLPWHHISQLGSLPNLQVLKLVSKAFEGSTWDMNDGEFLKLKFLQLEDLNIVEWNASSDHLPELQKLLLRNCKLLEGIPIEFVDIPNLQTIQVQQCGLSVEESVRRIQEEQLESGIQDLKILIGRADH